MVWFRFSKYVGVGGFGVSVSVVRGSVVWFGGVTYLCGLVQESGEAVGYV